MSIHDEMRAWEDKMFKRFHESENTHDQVKSAKAYVALLDASVPPRLEHVFCVFSSTPTILP